MWTSLLKSAICYLFILSYYLSISHRVYVMVTIYHDNIIYRIF